MLVLVGKHYVVEQEAVVTCYIDFRHVVGGMYLGNHFFQFGDSIPATVHYLLGIAIMSCLVNDIVKDIHQRMLEYLMVLLQVVFRHCFKRHTYGSVTIDLQML